MSYLKPTVEVKNTYQSQTRVLKGCSGAAGSVSGLHLLQMCLKVAWLRLGISNSMVRVRKNLQVEFRVPRCFKVEWLGLEEERSGDENLRKKYKKGEVRGRQS